MKSLRLPPSPRRAYPALAVFMCAASLQAQGVLNSTIEADTADRLVTRTHSTNFSGGFDGSGTLGTVGSTTAAVGNPGSYSGGNGTFGSFVVPFVLPELGALVNPFTSASVSFTQSGSVNTFANLGLDLYGLGRRGTADVLAGDYYTGALDSTDATRLADDFIVSNSGTTTASGTVFTFSGAALTNYLNSAYAGGEGAGSFVFLRLSLDRTPQDFFKTITFHTANASNEALRPEIIFSATAIPEPATAAVLGGMLALGVAAGLRRRRNA